MLKSPNVFQFVTAYQKLDEARLIAITCQRDSMVPGEFRAFTFRGLHRKQRSITNKRGARLSI
jgi:hypothetical protein